MAMIIHYRVYEVKDIQSRPPICCEQNMSQSGLPFDDIRELIRTMPGPDTAAAQKVAERDAMLDKATRRAWAVGRNCRLVGHLDRQARRKLPGPWWQYLLATME